MKKPSFTLLFFALLTLIICSAILPVFSLQNSMSIASYGTINYSGLPTPSPTPTPTPFPSPSPSDDYVGFRSNGEETVNYWISVANSYVSYFPGNIGVGQWIIPESNVVNFDAATDNALTAFDNAGVYVFLQVGDACYERTVDELIDLTLSKYGHHSCVLGWGIDVELRGEMGSYEYPAGWYDYPVSDYEATSWLNQIRGYNRNFKLFLKHWVVEMMPPTVRNGIIFIDDSQGFTGLSDMVNGFRDWANYFSNAEVGYGVGYEADSWWWSELSNPPRDIAQALFNNVPNAKWVYWVNFSIHEVFP